MRHTPSGRCYLSRVPGEGRALVLKRFESEDAARFGRQVALLSALAGPHLARLRAAGHDGGRPFQVLEAVEGMLLGEWLARRPHPAEVAVEVLRQISAALLGLHRRGLLHGELDERCCVVQVDAEGRPRVRLLDLGSACAPLRPGTEKLLQAAYLPPELSGLADLPRDGRADLYALGVIAYQILTGERPFRASPRQALIHQHLSTPAHFQQPVWQQLPEPLQLMVQRLLAKDPSQRYSHVQSLLEDLRCLALQSGPAAPAVDDPGGGAPAPRPPHYTLQSLDSGACLALCPPFQGREQLRAQLLAHWQQPDCGQLVLLGPAGAGKTALAQHWAGSLPAGTLLPHAGDGPRPLWARALDSLALASATLPADRRGQLRARWQPLAEELRGEIQGLCPAMADLLGFLRRPEADAASEDDTVRGLVVPPDLLEKPAECAARALRERLAKLFCGMLCDAAPLLLCFDDVHDQRGEDLAFTRLLQAQLQRQASSGLLLLLLGRSLPPGLAANRVWQLPPLSHDALRALAAAWLADGRLSEAQLEIVVGQAAGCPGALPGLLRRELHRSGRSSLPELASETLSAAAVLGTTFEQSQLRAVLPPSQEETLDARLREAADSGFLEQSGTRWRFTRPELRRRCLELLDARTRAELHRRAADALERCDEDGERAGAQLELYEHLRQAGESARALRQALPASETLLARGAFAQAARLLAGARTLLAGQRAWANGLLEREADAWLLADEAARAEACYREALDACSPGPERARLLSRCAETHLRRGQLLPAEETFAEAARQLAAVPDPQQLALRARISLGLVWCGFFRDARRGCRELLCLLRLTRRQPQPTTRATLCAAIAIFAATRGGLKLAGRWLAAAREAASPGSQAASGLIELAAGLLDLGRGVLDRARESLSQAEKSLAAAGQHWERRLALWTLARTALLQGDDAHAAQWGRRLREAAGGSGDVQGRGLFALLEAELMLLGHNFDGSIAAAVQAVASLQRSGDRRSEGRATILLAEAWLRKGRLGRAAEVAREASARLRAGRFGGIWGQRLRLLQAEIELGFASEIERARADFGPFLRRARQEVLVVLRRTPPPQIQCYALRVRGLLEAVGGDRGAAAGSLRAALELARQAGLQHGVEQTRDALEQLGRTGRVILGEEGADKPRARLLLDEEARAERDLGHLVQVASMLGSCTRREVLIERGLVAALQALVADAALLFNRDPGGDPLLEAAFDSRGQALPLAERSWDRGVVAAVLASGRARADHLAAEPGSLCTRSVLCAPLGVAGRVEGALYLDCQLVRRSFSSADLRLLQAIASLLGSGLMLVASLEELVRVNRELDGRVRERTARLEQVFAEREEIWAQVVRLEKASSQVQLAAGLSHDLNSPVGALGSLAESLLELAREPEPGFPELVREVAGTMRQAAGRCTDLVQSLRELGRGQEGETRDLDLKLVVEQGMKLFEHRLRGSWLVHRLDSCPVRAVLAEAHQVVLNLLDNALDATDGRGPVEIELHRDTEQAVLRVRNGGRAIPEELVQRAFSPGETSAPGKHLGLGLAIVKRLVEKHGGDVALTAGPASTELQVRWPLIPGESGQDGARGRG